MLTKNCAECNKEFVKPVNCSRKSWAKRKFCSQSCKQSSQVGKPSPKRGKTYPSRAKKLPCRICGEPTSQNGTIRNRLYGMVHCGNPTCAEESRQLKNKKISEKAIEMYASGERKRIRTAWSNVPRISKEEVALNPWFTAMGWESQHKFLTGVHTNKLPRMFRLDFALPEQRMYVEIDGSVHNSASRKERDARRDRMMAERGWTGLRVSADTVQDDLEKAKEFIKTWIDKNLCQATMPE